MAASLTTSAAEQIVRETNGYSPFGEPATTLVCFETKDGRQLAITLMDPVPQVWLEDGAWMTETLELVFPKVYRYGTSEGKQSNIERKAPRLAVGNAVIRVMTPTADMLRVLLAAYSTDAEVSGSDSSDESECVSGSEDEDVGALEGIAKEARYWSRSRNRKLRDVKLASSDGKCECCDVRYASLFGGTGKRALQVHHRSQLALLEEPEITSLEDLAVVCSNCHMMIHTDMKAAIPVEQLRDNWIAFNKSASTGR